MKKKDNKACQMCTWACASDRTKMASLACQIS